MNDLNEISITQLLTEQDNIDELRSIYDNAVREGLWPDQTVPNYLSVKATDDELEQLKNLEIPFLSAWAFDELIQRRNGSKTQEQMLYG